MKQTIAPQHGVGFELSVGDTLEVFDPLGEQVADLFCFSVHDPTDTLSSGRSIDREARVLFTTGSILYAESGRPMLKIISDTCGRHDFLLAPCTLQTFQKRLEGRHYHHNCAENLNFAFTPFPVYRDKISTTFNIFMNVRLEPEGTVKIDPPLSRPGDSIKFLALMDIYVGLTACANEAANNGRCKRIEYEIGSSTSSLALE